VFGLETLGFVHVFAHETFPVPDRFVSTKLQSTGEYSGVSIELPAGTEYNCLTRIECQVQLCLKIVVEYHTRSHILFSFSPSLSLSHTRIRHFKPSRMSTQTGAWPAQVTEGPSFTVFELPISWRRAGQDVAGKAVKFGPDGIEFNVPITISVPVDSNTDLESHHLRIFKYRPSSGTTPESWTEKEMPEGYEVPDQPSIIKGVTKSFSIYIAVKVPDDTSQEAGVAAPAHNADPNTVAGANVKVKYFA